VLQGKGKYLYDDGVEYAVEGQCQYCPEGHWHSMINEGPEDLVFYAVIPKKV
jgi:mannose-6-phosphate isomerase-like protein (cupin superfamily)